MLNKGHTERRTRMPFKSKSDTTEWLV